jgi:predicted CoA-binding protein
MGGAIKDIFKSDYGRSLVKIKNAAILENASRMRMPIIYADDPRFQELLKKGKLAAGVDKWIPKRKNRIETASSVEQTEFGPVLINPTTAQIRQLSQRVAQGVKDLTLDNRLLDRMDDTIRAIRDSSRTWYVWDASIATHGMMGEALGLSGKLELYRMSDEYLKDVGYRIINLRPKYTSSLGLEFMRKFGLKRPRPRLEETS